MRARCDAWGKDCSKSFSECSKIKPLTTPSCMRSTNKNTAPGSSSWLILPLPNTVNKFYEKAIYKTENNFVSLCKSSPSSVVKNFLFPSHYQLSTQNNHQLPP